ncbi:hypothetical protein [Rhodanobacter sp. L36]|uniref:hypothetical protein n=1 Tax=Rhodanobacter sp. L36 TaxID=1747221 RepID=UPI00131B5F29|nr:hypothetical protein [Rhodanobacter sp. L36]
MNTKLSLDERFTLAAICQSYPKAAVDLDSEVCARLQAKGLLARASDDRWTPTPAGRFVAASGKDE